MQNSLLALGFWWRGVSLAVGRQKKEKPDPPPRRRRREKKAVTSQKMALLPSKLEQVYSQWWPIQGLLSPSTSSVLRNLGLISRGERSPFFQEEEGFPRTGKRRHNSSLALHGTVRGVKRGHCSLGKSARVPHRNVLEASFKQVISPSFLNRPSLIFQAGPGLASKKWYTVAQQCVWCIMHAAAAG